MRIDLIRVTPTWWRRVLMVVIIPLAIVFTLIAEPAWAAIKMLIELIESFKDLPHVVQEIWAGKRLRAKKVGWFYFAGDPYP